MNTTMVRKFCTLKEAAERLNTTEERIENLLKKGILREFRDGSHRLLRTADIGAILAARNRRLERRGQPLQGGTALPSPSQRANSPSPHPSDRSRLSPTPGAGSQTGGRIPTSPKTMGPVRQSRNPGPKATDYRPQQSAKPHSRSGDSRTARGRREHEALPARPSLSIREWLWTGLIQDRPIAIALLSGLVLLVLSAVVAGACLLANLR